MATVTTVTPTVTTRPHIPGSPGDRSLAGEVDLATRESWSYVSSFVVGGLELTYVSGGPTVDIAQGRIARARPDADPSQELITVGAVSGVSLASSSVNYLYFKSDNDIEVRDADNPPSADAILIGTVDTNDGAVTEAVRGRSPISQFLRRAAVGTVIKSGAETLSSGVATVDTGVDNSNVATFSVYLGPQTKDAEVAADIQASSATGTYQIDIQETNTNIGSITVEYDIVRVR